MTLRLFAVSATVLLGCTAVSDDARRTDSARNDTAELRGLSDTELLDSTIAPAIAGRDGWNYQQRASVDLDGDGNMETAVLTARVELHRGRPAWDDGQAWQVYLVPAGGADTAAIHLYAQRLQLGRLTMRITRPDSTAETRSAILLIEHLPDRISIYEINSVAPGTTQTFLRLRRSLDPRGEQASVM